MTKPAAESNSYSGVRRSAEVVNVLARSAGSHASVQRGDPQKAETVMRKHLRSDKQRVLALLDIAFA
ncbi:hypothetical protein [Mycobacterium branderi]|uniref:Uncharacterized protein n=1 Tax=Mycobacterium branderi TaxID=43348 RepID=A0ABN6B2I5_9MYCO|nr:hypothetical protein [Mycobacterium branderi]BBZ11880.1 hypothetical protein MBRA_20750 [Mycobacterium branderi]